MNQRGATGRLRITAAAKGGRTVLTDVYRTAPFHPGPAHYRDNRAEVVLQEVSPGILPGDRLAISVNVEHGAALTVSGQGAAKLYPSPHGVLAESAISLSIARGGSLWWLPGPLIPFRDALYSARLTATLDSGSRLALLEIITPGRLSMGECDAYQRLELRVRIEVAGKPVFFERAVLDPVERPLAMAGSQGAFLVSGSLIAIGYSLPAEVNNHQDGVWLGAGGDSELLLVRGVARSAAALREVLLEVLRSADTFPGPCPPESSSSGACP